MRIWTAVWWSLATIFMSILGSDGAMVVLRTSSKNIKVPCTVGMKVSECRLKWSELDPITAKTMPFCDRNGHELHKDDTIQSSDHELLDMMVTDYAFKQAMTYNIYSCSLSKEQDVISRLDGAFEPNSKYSILTSNMNEGKITVYSTKSVLLQPKSEEGNVVAIPRGRMVTTDSIINRSIVGVWCDQDGKEQFKDSKTSELLPARRSITLFFKVDNLTLSMKTLICTKSTIDDLNGRVRKLYGPQFRVYCDQKDCKKDADLTVSRVEYHLDDLSPMLLSSAVEWCRGCTLSISIAIVMFLNAVFFIAMAAYMRHQDRAPCDCERPEL